MNLKLTDTHVYLDRWPFRRVPGDEPQDLIAKLRENQVEQAWVASFEGVFHRDLTSCNQRLATTCQTLAPDLLVPFGAVNPLLPDWEEDLRRLVDAHQMPGIRLYPGYHGYRLDAPEFARLLDAATARKLWVQLVVSLEDERTQPRLARVAPVNLAPLLDLVRDRPELRLQLLNPFRGPSTDALVQLAAAGRVYVDIANLETVGGVERLAERLPVERILFGSHFPLFYWESARLKLRESTLSREQLESIANGARVLREMAGR